jgi:hypothetical protein
MRDLYKTGLLRALQVRSNLHALFRMPETVKRELSWTLTFTALKPK